MSLQPPLSGVLQRSLGILELLAAEPAGLSLGAVATRLNLPRSATHRLLNELVHYGYVQQIREQGDYMLTTKLVALGLSFLGASGILDIAQPILDRVAQVSGEFVRLAILEGERLTWVGRAQGARPGLRYDPEMGATAMFSCTATGHAVMLAMTDDEALSIMGRQGMGTREEYGPNAPTTPTALLKALKIARKRGVAIAIETFTPGMAAIAAPVRKRGQAPLGAISIAGPHVRLTEEKMLLLADTLLAAAAELAAASQASPLMNNQSNATMPHVLARP